jgi:hypothetical protein
VKSIRPVLQGPDPITGSQIVATLSVKYKEGVSEREWRFLCFVLCSLAEEQSAKYKAQNTAIERLDPFALSARPIAEDCDRNQHQHGHKDYNYRDLDRRNEEADEQNELFQ